MSPVRDVTDAYLEQVGVDRQHLEPRHTPFLDAEAVLAAFRITRLVVDDGITIHPRRKLIAAAYDNAHGEVIHDRLDQIWPGGPVDPSSDPAGQPWEKLVPRDPDPPKIAYLVTCPWCVGLYVAGGVALLEAWDPPGWSWVRRVLAGSALVGLIAGHETP